jgi:hypothetical protein
VTATKMRFASALRLGLDPARVVGAAFVGAGAAACLFSLLVGGVLGATTLEVEGVVSAVVFYAVLTAPRRMAQAAAWSQARDAVLLSASAAACLEVTGSRAKTILALRSRDEGMAAALLSARRAILLGSRAADAMAEAASKLHSYSAANIMASLGAQEPGKLEEGGEESQGIVSSSALLRETKLPMFMTICFFAPILLVMYSVLSHVSGAQSYAELVALEVILLDLGYGVLSSGGGAAR